MSFLQQIFQFFCGSSEPGPEPRPGRQEDKPYPQQPSVPSRPQQPHQAAQVVAVQQPHQEILPEGRRAYPSSPPHRPNYHADQNQDQINQHDERYTSLRAQASSEGDLMSQKFKQSQEAYARGDGALAKQLSMEGKEHQRKMESFNKEASDWIFLANNRDKKAGEVDLHGLYVKEAIAHADTAIQNAKQRGDSEVHLIVGKGLHSQGGVAKIKPAIEELMQKEQIVAELDPHNEGVLIVHLDGARGGETIGPDEISRRLAQDDKGCIIM